MEEPGTLTVQKAVSHYTEIALRVGAYGIALAAPGLPAAALGHLGPAPVAWPRWSIERAAWPTGAPGALPESLDERRLALPLVLGGSLLIDRDAHLMRLSVPEDQPAESLVHPWLSPAFSLHVLWGGGLAIHAGVIEIDGRAWGVIGTKGAGKTTMLAGLARAGAAVMSDDIAAVHGDTVLGGPRFVDLRRGAAQAAFPEAEPLGRAGVRSRWRLPTGPAPMVAPLAGWWLLEWGDALAIEEVPIVERVPRLAEALLIPHAPREPHALLDQTMRPMLRLTRPRRFDALDAACAALIEAAQQRN